MKCKVLVEFLLLFSMFLCELSSKSRSVLKLELTKNKRLKTAVKSFILCRLKGEGEVFLPLLWIQGAVVKSIWEESMDQSAECQTIWPGRREVFYVEALTGQGTEYFRGEHVGHKAQTFLKPLYYRPAAGLTSYLWVLFWHQFRIFCLIEAPVAEAVADLWILKLRGSGVLKRFQCCSVSAIAFQTYFIKLWWLTLVRLFGTWRWCRSWRLLWWSGQRVSAEGPRRECRLFFWVLLFFQPPHSSLCLLHLH